MNWRRGDGLLFVAGLLAFASAVVTAFAGTRAGLVVLSLAVAAALVALARVSSLLFRRLELLGTQGARTRKAVRIAQRENKRATRSLVTQRTKQLRTAQGRTREAVARVATAIDDVHRVAEANAFRVRTSLDTLPSDTIRLGRVIEKVAPDGRGLPGLGDWAILPATLLTMMDEVYSRPGPVTILECGSGSSTVFFALALAERGRGGSVMALDSDARFAEETREHLRRHGVDEFATVVDAPLTEIELDVGTRHLWFDLSAMPPTEPVDILFVDGPVGGSSRLARYPAIPVFGDRLAPGAMVVLDDTDRPEEQQIVRRWLSEPAVKERIAVERKNVRSTVFRVT